MSTRIETVDEYLRRGCGRCPLWDTPKCKTIIFREQLGILRKILNTTELTETLKWSYPCYTYGGKNVLLLSAFKDYCAVSFFKGSLLADDQHLLVKQSENTHSTRQLRFTTSDMITEQQTSIISYIMSAIEIEKKGLTPVKTQESKKPLPSELAAAFEADPAFRQAFEALTPGRQRGYLLHLSSTQNPETVRRRIERVSARIFQGLGLHDR